MFKLSGSNHPNLLLVYEKARKIYDENFLFEKRKKRRKILRFIRRFSIGVITVFAIIAFYMMTHLINLYTIQKEAVLAKNNIDTAVELLKKQNNDAALYYSGAARDGFELSLDYISEYKNSFFVKNSDFFHEQYSDLLYLFATGKTLSTAVSEMAKVQKGLDYVFTNQENEDFLNFVYESAPELFGVKANVDLSTSYFSKIKKVGLLKPFTQEINEIGEKLAIASYLLDQQIALSQILPSFLGYPDEAKYLVLFQDNNKLTATGGEIKAYGVLKNSSGKMVDFQSFNSEKLDESVKDKMNNTLPKALASYTDKEKWLFSDSNWSPNLSYTADKILSFYSEETGDNSNLAGIIMLNYDFLKEFLNLTGPIVVNDNSYSATNFSRIFEENGQTEDLAKIIEKGQAKIFSDEYHNVLNIFNLLSSSFVKKNIVLYFNDVNFQAIAEEKGWSNEIKKTESDYFMIIDSNLSESSNENNIKKKIDYQLDQGANGLFAKLDLVYINNSETRYKNYIRVYLPVGSELLIFDGLETDTLEILEDKQSEKAIYAGLINLEPEKIANLTIYYKLPDYINDLALKGEYDLLVQKQSGSKISSLTVDLKFINSIKLYNPADFSTDLVSDKQVIWDTNLLTDRYFSINF